MQRAAERFWNKVQKTETCWIWIGGRRGNGPPEMRYGEFYLEGKVIPAHRYAYELLIGSVPVGLDLDHLCRVHACVNPAHLEPVTHRENLRRGAGFIARKMAQIYCKQGHQFTVDNTYWWRGRRHCRQCRAVCAAIAEAKRPDRSTYFREYWQKRAEYQIG